MACLPSSALEQTEPQLTWAPLPHQRRLFGVSGGISSVTDTPLPWNDWLACYPALTLALAGTLDPFMEHGAAILQKHGRLGRANLTSLAELRSAQRSI